MNDFIDKLQRDLDGFYSVKQMPTPDELEKFYKELYFQDESVRSKNYQNEYDEKELSYFQLMADQCMHSIYLVRPQWRAKPGDLLEIGVGEGFLLSRARYHGWNVTGIDYGNYGIKKFNPDILNCVQIGNTFEILHNIINQNKKFHVCVLQNVLEHVINPSQLLNDVRKLLTDDGIVVVTIPNDFSKTQLRALELGHIKEHFWVIPPQHLHYFNTSNIQNFVTREGFKIIDMYSTFPIDFFLFNPLTNYITNPNFGKMVHRARIELDLMLANENLENYHKLSQSYALCQVGRDFTLILESL